MNRQLILASALVLTSCGLSPMAVANNPTETGSQSQTRTASSPNRKIETGRVNWLRNLDEAKTKAKEADKPILLLFQEIPG